MTKRAERLTELAPDLPWPENVWIGVTVESADYLKRVDCLRETEAYIKFLSLEPLPGPVSGLDLLSGMDLTTCQDRSIFVS